MPFPHPRSRPLAPHVCGWMQMIIIDGQLCPWKDISNPAPREEKKKLKRSLCITFRHIHNPVKLFWLLRLITCFNVGNNFTTTNAFNILSEFPCSLTKISHGFNTNKTKNHGYCSHGNRKLIMVLLLQTIGYKEVVRCCCFFSVVIKTVIYVH